MTGMLSMAALVLMAADNMVNGQQITIPVRQVKAGGPRVVRLQVVNDNIIRVQATSESQLPEKQSLIVVNQTAKPKFTVTDGSTVIVKAKNVEARVERQTGRVTFYDAQGHQILREAENGKTFQPFRVPDREIGVDIAKVTEEQRNGLSWRLLFEQNNNEALYGLGQHQSEELNMKGRNEDLFQYNTKVSCGTRTVTAALAIPTTTCSWVVPSSSTTSAARRDTSLVPMLTAMARSWCATRIPSTMSSTALLPPSWPTAPSPVASRICPRTSSWQVLR